MSSSIGSAVNYSLPRVLPAFLRLQVLFGNPLAIMGVFFTLFGGTMAVVMLSVIAGQEVEGGFPLPILFTLIFPLIGLGFAFFAVRRGMANLELLKNGLVTKGKVTNMEATNVKINNQTVYKVFFEFKTPGGIVHSSSCRTHSTYRLRDEAEELLVYNANDPSKAVLLDALPKAVKKFFEKLETGF